ncbi:signal peptidase I [Paenibacillus roseipurpureus]|uniref:Signal peptidase I n=1 Tax=Paenibacillus roseopurpureus TaxID=2918901 RepID=A0AA96LR32_9BACL|nr:signal peptidase I [Paenibacillus sp. MBLB1832]WNR45011.1 signal peptidase I [Paenibacillus sp. MBLB1832]
MSFFIGGGSSNQAEAVPNRVQESRSLTQELWDWTKSILVALLVVVIVHQFVFNFSTVRGHSMDPTLNEGEWLLVNKAITYLQAPDRGDIVILEEPDKLEELKPSWTQHSLLVKRVVAVAGDEVQGRAGALYVNGDKVVEPFTDSPIEDGDFGPTEVGPGQIFVMGDNRHRAASADSRMFGVIPTSLVEGRAEFVMWPFDKAARL